MSRDALAQGEVWRLLTGHLTHFTAEHLKWDVVVFVALGSLVELRNRRHFLGCVAGSALAVSLGVWWLQPQFSSYRGLSGVDSALFGYIAMDVLKLACDEGRRWPAFAAIVAMTLFLAKIVFELITGRALFVDSTAHFDPVPLAHLVGAVAGGLCVFGNHLVAFFIRRRALASVARGQPKLMRMCLPRGEPKNEPSERPTPCFSK